MPTQYICDLSLTSMLFCSLIQILRLDFFVFNPQLKILELTSVLTNKLDFLEVSQQGVSDLKILLIEMEVSTIAFI